MKLVLNIDTIEFSKLPFYTWINVSILIARVIDIGMEIKSESSSETPVFRISEINGQKVNFYQ